MKTDVNSNRWCNMETNAHILLEKLMMTIVCTHLDMGGNDKYTPTHKSLPIIKEIKLYLYKTQKEHK